MGIEIDYAIVKTNSEYVIEYVWHYSLLKYLSPYPKVFRTKKAAIEGLKKIFNGITLYELKGIKNQVCVYV